MTNRPNYSAKLPLAVGLAALMLLVGGAGFWSVRTQISGAIVAPGTVVIEHNRQVVQHAEGGIVGEIAARDGDTVEGGDLLIALDDTLLTSELAVAELQLIELRARRARLEAERDEAADVVFPDALLSLSGEAATQQIEGQRVLFEARRETFEKELGQIAERIEQTSNRIEGAGAQLAALTAQEKLIVEELKEKEGALARGLTIRAPVSILKRELVSVAGEIGKLTSDVAEYRGEISTLNLEAVKLRNKRRAGAISELRDIQFRELELIEKRQSLVKRIERLDIRAPVSGIVFGSSVFGQNAVVQPAEPLMFVIPQDQPLIISARVEAIHIDQIHLGQTATIRFSAFNQRTTPEIAGEVSFVSADILQDEATGMTFYRVDLLPLESDLPKLDGQQLLPGMPVEAFLRTEDRTPLSYLVKPFTDYFERALRET